MKNRLRRAVKIFPAFVIGMILYIAFHELGHLIVAVSAGATITEYSIIHAHTSWVGGTFTINKYIWANVNGALLPILLSYIYALTYSEKIKNEFYKAISFCGIRSTFVFITSVGNHPHFEYIWDDE